MVESSSHLERLSPLLSLLLNQFLLNQFQFQFQSLLSQHPHLKPPLLIKLQE
jgi:hypothetical protein